MASLANNNFYSQQPHQISLQDPNYNMLGIQQPGMQQMFIGNQQMNILGQGLGMVNQSQMQSIQNPNHNQNQGQQGMQGFQVQGSMQGNMQNLHHNLSGNNMQYSHLNSLNQQQNIALNMNSQSQSQSGLMSPPGIQNVPQGSPRPHVTHSGPQSHSQGSPNLPTSNPQNFMQGLGQGQFGQQQTGQNRPGQQVSMLSSNSPMLNQTGLINQNNNSSQGILQEINQIGSGSQNNNLGLNQQPLQHQQHTQFLSNQMSSQKLEGRSLDQIQNSTVNNAGQISSISSKEDQTKKVSNWSGLDLTVNTEESNTNAPITFAGIFPF